MVTSIADVRSQIVRLAGNTYYAPKMSPIAKTVRTNKLTYLSPLKFVQLERALAEVCAKGVQGDVVEFGLALGGSGIVLASQADGRTFHGFDLFGQIPPPTSPNDGDDARARYEVIASGASEGLGGQKYYGYEADLLGKVTTSFRDHGVQVDGERVQLHRGLFEESWPMVEAEITTISFAHIDCDWYDPVRYCLEAVTPRLALGGIIVLDDYFDYGGCRTATDEFLTSHPELSFRHQRGNASLVKRA